MFLSFLFHVVPMFVLFVFYRIYVCKGRGSIPRLRRTTDVSGLVGMSSGHCTHPTGGPAIRLKYKKTYLTREAL